MTIDLVSARRELEDQLTRLNGELVELEKARENARQGKDETAGYGNGVGEAATETSAAELDHALIGKLEQLREHVQEAIQKVDEGTYGTCQTCGEAIPEERLQALPHATECVSCKSKSH